MKKLLLHFIKTQTREEGDHTATFKVLFNKMYIVNQELPERELHINKRLMDCYMKKLSQ